MDKELFKYIIYEYGFSWAIYRFLYALKIKAMKIIPIVERIFEKKVSIKKIDIFDIDTVKIAKFLKELPREKQVLIIKDADDAILGKLKAFSSIPLNYGDPINWHL